MSDEARLLYSTTAEIEALQLERLRTTLERAKKAPFFAERLSKAKVGSLADVARLPLTTKKDLQDASPFGSVAVPNSELFQYHE
jgi:phenylacetate-CoA ligase